MLSLAVDASSPGTLYATTDKSGVYKSADGGARWSTANQGLTSRYVGVVTVQSGAVYAGSEGGADLSEHRRRGELDRAHAPDDARRRDRDRCRSAVSAGHLRRDQQRGHLQELGRRDDVGHTPGQLSKGTVRPRSRSTKASTLYATTHDGLFRSDDSGTTWKGLHKSLKSWNVLGLVIDPASPKTLYAATAIGFYKSLDGGGAWVMQNPDLYVSALSLDPRATSVLYAGTHLGVLKSVDAGAKWAPLRLAPDPNAPPPRLPAAGSALPASNLPKLPVARRTARDRADRARRPSPRRCALCRFARSCGPRRRPSAASQSATNSATANRASGSIHCRSRGTRPPGRSEGVRASYL